MGIQEQEDDNMKEQTEVTDDSEYEYRLVGIVDHMGSADAGHYLSYINVENDKIFKPKP